MRKSITTMFVLAAALSLEATAASAQVRSTRRIPVTKEAPGEVAVPRVDTVTVTVYKTDTLRVYRTDTVTKTAFRVDTVRLEAPAPMPEVLQRIGGFYWGLAGGASMLGGNWNDQNHTGWRVEMPFGIDPAGSPLGLRFNLGASQYEPHSFVANTVGNATLLNADADLKLRIAGANRLSSHIELYGVGGGTYNRYKDVVEFKNGVYTVGDVSGTTGQLPTSPDHSWHDAFGFNVGGGVQFGWGKGNIFVESRYSRFNSTATLANVPLVVGFTWF